VTYLLKHGTIDFDTVRKLIDDHYQNGAKHCSDAMSRMVKKGIVQRVKPGVFKLGNPKGDGIKEVVDPNQSSLF
jgi:predicted transcriptional regulator of viral defense system